MQIPEFELERFFAKWEFNTRFTMCSSDCETLPMSDLIAHADDECLDLWKNLRLGYTEAPGHPKLRREIANLYDEVEPDNVLCFAGAEEAIFVLANVLLGPGDHAIAFWPAYQSLYEVARATGAELSLIELKEEEGWQIQIDRVRTAIRTNTKAIIVNAPHNPTGTLPPASVFHALMDIAEECGAALICDEVYRYLEYDQADRLPAAVDLSETAVSIGVMSKAFGLAGLRIGWVASRNVDLLRKMAAFKDYTTICNSAPSEILALIAIRNDMHVVERNRAIVSENLALLDDFMERSDYMGWVRPSAGCIGFPRLLRGDVGAMAEKMAREAGVLILPGSTYGHPGNHFRIGFGRTNFPQALGKAEKWLGQNL